MYSLNADDFCIDASTSSDALTTDIQGFQDTNMHSAQNSEECKCMLSALGTHLRPKLPVQANKISMDNKNKIKNFILN